MRAHRRIVALAVFFVCAACSAPPRVLLDPRIEWIDLTHDFAEDAVYWPTADGFEFVVDAKGMTDGGYWYEANSFRTSEHGGTHLDAPVHFAKGAHTADQIPLEKLIGPGYVIDVAAQCEANRDYQVTVDDIATFERDLGPIPVGAIVLLHTGFGRYWPDRERYMGTAARGLEASFQLHFPGLGPAAAKVLVARGVSAVGIDTPSIDHGPSRLFHAHRVLYAANIPAFENVAHLDLLPPTGSFIVALPMKIRGGSGGPLRIVAALPEH